MIIINLVGLLLIGLIVWWFWLYKPEETEMGEEVVITVENGIYSPSRITIPSGSPVAIQFLRKDPSPCSESLLIPDLQISDSLPQNTLKTIYLPAMKPGTYEFHCQMQMYRGQITVQ